MLLPALALLLAGCDKFFLFDFDAKDREPVTINFTQSGLFPEGLVFDPLHKRFYVSSTSRGSIGIVTPAGTYTPFIRDEVLTRTTGLWRK